MGFVGNIGKCGGVGSLRGSRGGVCGTRQAAAHGIRMMCEDSASMKEVELSQAVVGSAGSAAVSLPDSMQDSMVRAKGAFDSAYEQGYRRIIIEVDLSLGDETYTNLRNTLPLLKEFAKETFGTGTGLAIVFPDAGTAALSVRSSLQPIYIRTLLNRSVWSIRPRSVTGLISQMRCTRTSRGTESMTVSTQSF
uniref:DUF1995 domain-containing protein n=1 Tax=Rhodosorus marinus TaxID=101924 RepID=A0A7S2ZLM9_9RHOD|mmetsp:Transcript_23135/g.92497  ORF Transcript_23135/g.92497 Transcript_23135/m.92497 type:complete len:193 (+) Transcript_23135:135-713(+)